MTEIHKAFHVKATCSDLGIPSILTFDIAHGIAPRILNHLLRFIPRVCVPFLFFSSATSPRRIINNKTCVVRG